MCLNLIHEPLNKTTIEIPIIKFASISTKIRASLMKIANLALRITADQLRFANTDDINKIDNYSSYSYEIKNQNNEEFKTTDVISHKMASSNSSAKNIKKLTIRDQHLKRERFSIVTNGGERCGGGDGESKTQL